MTYPTLPPARLLELPGHLQDGTPAVQYGELRVLITDVEDHGPEGLWRHVSVSCEARLPTYEELGLVRDRHFDPHRTVLEVIPPASAWVNQHATCLHLWQRLDAELLPQGLHGTVGIRGGVPFDGYEVALMRRNLHLAAELSNLLRARGTLRVSDAFDALSSILAPGVSRQSASMEIRRQLERLVKLAEGRFTLDADGMTFRYAQPTGEAGGEWTS